MSFPKGKIAWNKGLTKSSDKRVAKYSNSLKDRIFSSEHRSRISDTLSDGRLRGSKNPNWKGGLIEITCDYCGKKKWVKRKDTLNKKYLHCNRECFDKNQSTIMKNVYKNNPEIKKKIARKGKDNGNYGKSAAHGKGNWFIDRKGNKIWMRSSYEIKFASWLDKNLLTWEYEYKRFILTDRTYCPDFWIKEWEKWIEIKGWYHQRHQETIRQFKEKYPKEKIEVLTKDKLLKMKILDR